MCPFRIGALILGALLPYPSHNLAADQVPSKLTAPSPTGEPSVYPSPFQGLDLSPLEVQQAFQTALSRDLYSTLTAQHLAHSEHYENFLILKTAADFVQRRPEADAQDIGILMEATRARFLRLRNRTDLSEPVFGVNPAVSSGIDILSLIPGYGPPASHGARVIAREYVASFEKLFGENQRSAQRAVARTILSNDLGLASDISPKETARWYDLAQQNPRFKEALNTYARSINAPRTTWNALTYRNTFPAYSERIDARATLHRQRLRFPVTDEAFKAQVQQEKARPRNEQSVAMRDYLEAEQAYKDAMKQLVEQTAQRHEQQLKLIIAYLKALRAQKANPSSQDVDQNLQEQRRREFQATVYEFQTSANAIALILQYSDNPADQKTGQQILAVTNAAVAAMQAGQHAEESGTTSSQVAAGLSYIGLILTVYNSVVDYGLEREGLKPPTANQIIIQELSFLRQELQQVRKEHRDQYFALDAKLNALHYLTLDSLEVVLTALADVHRSIDDLRRELNEFRQNVELLRKEILTRSDRILTIIKDEKELREAERWTHWVLNSLYTREQLPEPEYSEALSHYQTVCLIGSRQDSVIGPLAAQEGDFADKAVLERLSEFPPSAQLDFLSRYAAAKLNYSGMLQGTTRLPDTDIWIRSANAYCQVYEDNPRHAATRRREGFVALIQDGERILAALRAIKTAHVVPNGPGSQVGEVRPNVLNTTFLRSLVDNCAQSHEQILAANWDKALLEEFVRTSNYGLRFSAGYDDPRAGTAADVLAHLAQLKKEKKKGRPIEVRVVWDGKTVSSRMHVVAARIKPDLSFRQRIRLTNLRRPDGLEVYLPDEIVVLSVLRRANGKPALN